MADIPSTSPDRTTLQSAVQQLSEARTELWTAQDADQLSRWKTADNIDEARGLLGRLDHYLRRREEAEAAGKDEVVMEAPAPEPPAPSALRRALEQPATAAARVARQRLARNVIVLAVLGAATLWTGLTLLYFDKPFGTGRDYVNALLWGFGAQVALEGIAAAIDRTRARGVVPA
jgi:hypothetical protein